MNGVRHRVAGVLPSHSAVAMSGESAGDTARDLRVLIVAFSARYALAQLLDEMFNALSRRIDCRVLVPTNYSGGIPERCLMRAPCGMSKIGGIVASFNPLAHWKTVSAIWRSKPSVIHILSGEGYTWAVSLALAARLSGIPVVVTLHDPEPHPGSIIERLNSFVRRPVLVLARAVHVFSSQHLDRAEQLAVRARFAVIAHGSLAGRFLQHRKYGVRSEELVLFFGRIQPYKGLDVLLRAMSVLPATIRLAVAGPGTLEPDIQERIGALGSRAELHNKYLDDAEVAALMQRASVVALPYRHATQSSVPAIAAAFGCPMVASALGHFVEEIPRLGGLLVAPGDPIALAAALAEVLAARPPVQIASPTFGDLAESFVGLYQSCERQALPYSSAEQGDTQ
jgi:glycosyltransferase involved in cell wall biosynthesis